MSQSPFQPRLGAPPGNLGHARFWERPQSRRRFLQSAGAAGLALGGGLWLPTSARADDDDKVVDPKPLPGGIHLPFVPNVPIFHFFMPAHGFEPCTITDFKGFIGVARFLGTGTGTDTATGKKKALNFEADMRFMKGVYVGVDGKHHKGAFSFLWMDLFDGPLDFVTFKGNIHSYDPGITKSGLVWTRAIPRDSVKIHLGEKTASYKLADVPLKDSFNIPDAFKQGPNVPATVSFEIHWSGGDKLVQESDAKVGFFGRFLEDSATMAWSVKQKGFEFVSDPAKTSTTTFAEIGFERNGVFFNKDDDDDDDDD